MEILKSDLFTPWQDPDSGVTSYILSKKIAPVQEVFYYVNNSMSADGRYLWFFCAYPPSEKRTLGLLDMQTGEMSAFPDTQFSGTPHVDPATGDIFLGMGSSVWRRGKRPHDQAQLVGSLPEELIGARRTERVATHLTLSADGKELFLDAFIGLQAVFGTLNIETGAYEHWHSFNRNHNHAQFSPTDPDLVLFAQENHPDPITGLTFRITDRMWLMRRGEQPRPVFDEPTVVTHEWWDEDGEHVWCIHKTGTWRVNIHTQEVENVWPQSAWHSHHHPNGKYVVGDAHPGRPFYRGVSSEVGFLNRETGKSIRFIENPEKTGYVGANYHIDPHPRFVGSGQYITFTTTVCGGVDLAIIPTADLVERTSS